MTHPLDVLVIRLRAAVVVISNVVAGVMVGWFMRWHNSPSLVRMGHLVGGHWSIVGCWLLLAAVLVLFPRTRAIGYGATSVVYLLAGIWLAVVSHGQPRNNGLAVVGLLAYGAILLCGVITAQQDRGRRDAP